MTTEHERNEQGRCSHSKTISAQTNAQFGDARSFCFTSVRSGGDWAFEISGTDRRTWPATHLANHILLLAQHTFSCEYAIPGIDLGHLEKDTSLTAKAHPFLRIITFLHAPDSSFHLALRGINCQFGLSGLQSVRKASYLTNTLYVGVGKEHLSRVAHFLKERFGRGLRAAGGELDEYEAAEETG
ncbi:hypothetical protein PR048_017125 [Dryococelus australis]|uniref:Uncharacterized protein n=1 Tax=Dryococelus australis TaxID=614101 RepID=A0ABQ9H8P5_9NEOP|nr:hypothetical protein PR048_017125 [Dryococelus australis]